MSPRCPAATPLCPSHVPMVSPLSPPPSPRCPPCPHSVLPLSPQDLLRAISGTLIFLVAALVALASSRDALAATTFTFSLVLALVFAFDTFVTFRTRVAPGQDPDMEGS
ncbi:CKLF-like MARVEL transmembrane domain-containing protein 5 [Onychostruthus taczanowskii]|uniref:CKLF-like MARVEL transmembrane domain-containing protein 5 n=1 Tax=Onychostruthus taczanowskii TaxID=356909 RepID=UPI001B80D5FB|nr:CKLF-like MARVEL transmembrane domain-containing protein 5 [Onychostruthus taczanowskii]